MSMRLTELRRNPEKNPRLDVLDVLTSYKDDPNVFFSMTAVPKLGINPKSRYDTPLGIYAYPVREAFQFDAFQIPPDERDARHDFGNLSAFVPYAGDSPFVTVFRVKDPSRIVSDFNDYSDADFQRDVEKMRKIVNTNPEYNFNDVIDHAVRTRWDGAQHQSPFGHFWWVTYKLSDSMSFNRWSGERKVANPHSVLWNSLMRALGYDGFVDRHGHGIIHVNEPVQAVFMSTSSIEVIDRHENKIKNTAKTAHSAIVRATIRLVINGEAMKIADKLVKDAVGDKSHIPADERQQMVVEIRREVFRIILDKIEKVLGDKLSVLTDGTKRHAVAIGMTSFNIPYDLADMIQKHVAANVTAHSDSR